MTSSSKPQAPPVRTVGAETETAVTEHNPECRTCLKPAVYTVRRTDGEMPANVCRRHVVWWIDALAEAGYAAEVVAVGS